MFTGNILEYNSLFNIQVKTGEGIDLIEAHDENNDVDIDITIHAIIFQPISKITVMCNVNK